MQKKIIPITLAAALLISSFLSLVSISHLQGNARIINYTGVVRGATQRLVKQELNNNPNDALMEKIDAIIEELLTGEGENGLARLDDPGYLELATQMKEDWQQIRQQIYQVREGDSPDQLYAASERFFELADQVVSAAERYTEDRVLMAQKSLFSLTCAFILLAVALSVYTSRQSRRQKALAQAEEANQRRSEYLSRMSEALRAPMNDISELMYVADPETYELLFINDAGRKTFGVDALDGQKCYRVLQNADAPCSFCTNRFLKDGETYTWEYTNPITGCHYLLKDRLIEWDGRTARMEIAFDNTQSECEKLQLRFTLDAEKMITECIRTLYQESVLESAIPQVLKRLGSFLQAGRAYIVSIHEDSLCEIYQWSTGGAQAATARRHNVPLSAIRRWLPSFDQRGCIVIEDVETLKDIDPAEYEFLRSQSVHSLVAAPMEMDGTLTGYLGVDNPLPDHMSNIASLLQTLCYFLMLAWRHAQSQKQLSQLSYYDRLTSFYNRNRYIEDTKDLSSTEVSVGIVYLDVNGLKDINDQRGHAYGDEVLAECARRMKRAFPGANFYRIGGDEFVIICPGMEKELFESRTRDLKAQFRADPMYRAAIGSRWSKKIDDLNQIIADADARMYEDKKTFYRTHPASNRYRHHSDELLHLADPAVLQEEIRQNRFVVYLQPKISCPDRTAVGTEALIRYQPRPDALVLPGNFLPLMEETGAVSQIDFFVFKFVCSRLKRWMEQGKAVFPVSVNFSRCSLAQPMFVEQLTTICDSSGISPELLEIEITESLREVEDLDIRALIIKIREAGFSVAIDDFGTEYANLALLSSVEFDVLKLDKSMVGDVAHNPRTRAIVESIAEICGKLGIRMVAEGIETEEQMAALNACGVRLAQGFLFGKPVCAGQFEETYLQQ